MWPRNDDAETELLKRQGKEKWIVCSAWPYVNTVPHLGTFVHLLSADIYSRYLRARGCDVVSVSGSDEHGTPIEVEALREGITPRQLTDQYHNLICDLLRKYRIDLSNYTRTESPVHVRFTQDFYRKLYDNGHIISQEVLQLYCSTCGRFLPDRFVEGTCPHCGFDSARGDQCDSCGRVLEPIELQEPRCVFCGSRPVQRTSTHWFLDLPKFAKKIEAYIDSNKQLPENARNFSKRWLQEGLKLRALTRDNKWGIPAPFPGAEEKTIYVWLEAVLGYVSATKEWAERQGNVDLWKDYWMGHETKNLHFIGKDNIPFHTIILPALLMASGKPYVLPWQISSTEFILFEGQKFSKSRRIGIWMDEALEIAEADYWRFVLAAIRPEGKDTDFTWAEFEGLVNSVLNDVIGNYVHRTLTFITNNFHGIVPEPSVMDELDSAFRLKIASCVESVSQHMDNFKIRDGLNSIVEFIRSGNQFLSTKEPWHSIEQDPSKAKTTLYLAVQAVRSVAILLTPFMPATSERIWAQLALSCNVHDQSWGSAGELLIQPGHKIGNVAPLLHKVKADDIRKRLASRGRRLK